jgi:HEAT repeat protein
MMLYAKFRADLQHYFLLRSVRRGLASPAREVRAEAIQAIVLLGDKKGMRRALRNSDPWVRTEAVKGLTRLQGAGVARHLVRALADQSPEVAHAAAECLSRLEGPGMVRALRRCVTAEDWIVRYFGVIGLARRGSHDVLPLLETLQSDAHPWIREEATQALRRLTQEPAKRVEEQP